LPCYVTGLLKQRKGKTVCFSLKAISELNLLGTTRIPKANADKATIPIQPDQMLNNTISVNGAASKV